MKKVIILVVVLFLMAGVVTSYAGTIMSKGSDGSNTIQKVYEDIAGWDWKPVTGTESKKKTKAQKK